jgi:hypothetical protein
VERCGEATRRVSPIEVVSLGRDGLWSDEMERSVNYELWRSLEIVATRMRDLLSLIIKSSPLSQTSPNQLPDLARRASSRVSPRILVALTSLVRKKHPSLCPSWPRVLISCQVARHCQQNSWLHSEPITTTSVTTCPSHLGRQLTCHVETIFALLDVRLASSIRALFGVGPDPCLGFCKAGIAMISLILVFSASLSFVPRHFMLEAHLEMAYLAGDLGVMGTSLIQLAIIAARTETPAEVLLLGQECLEQEFLVPNSLVRTNLEMWAGEGDIT